MDEYRILTGTAKEIEKELNKLNENNILLVCGVCAINEQTTVVIQLMVEKEYFSCLS